MNEITMTAKEITAKTVCIVKFGPATETSGFKPGEYYQVTIDPSKVSPTGEYIRFGMNDGDEILGWQRVEAMTVVEVLGEWEDEDTAPKMTIGCHGVTMMVME